MILDLVAYIFDSKFDDTPLGQLITDSLLQHTLIFAAALVVVGIVLSVVEKAGRKVAASRNRCRVCGASVPHGAIYCRAHLRSVLEAEDRRTHSGTTRVPKV